MSILLFFICYWCVFAGVYGALSGRDRACVYAAVSATAGAAAGRLVAHRLPELAQLPPPDRRRLHARSRHRTRPRSARGRIQ